MASGKCTSLPCSSSELKKAILHHTRYTLGKHWEETTTRDRFLSLGMALRDRLIDRMLETENRYVANSSKRLYYLSMEFLMGRSLGNNLINLGLMSPCKKAMAELKVDLSDLCENEEDAALGNGGLGRLAACFLDSLATLDMPGFGYGINYEYGLFKQEILNGYQREKPDHWLARWTPWQIERADQALMVPVYGKVVHGEDRFGHYNPMWMDWQIIVGVPHDMPIVGYGGKTVNYLRLYSARSSDEFDMQIFNEGDYFRAVEEKISSETISKVLYPSDSMESGRELRLLQEYFFVACAIRDIVRRFQKLERPWDEFPNHAAIQLNDTHPALAVAELMRILVDESALDWEPAWNICRATCSYTNHTLLPEALEKWPLPLFEKVLPRHLQIIYEINHRFLEKVSAHWPGQVERLNRMSLIEESNPPKIRMANLAIVGSHSVNGVAELHSELVKKHLVPDFYQMWPERFNNKTNGITQRRWLLMSNPALASLVTETIGKKWITDLYRMRELKSFANDSAFQDKFLQAKQINKNTLAKYIAETQQVTVDPNSLFDIHIKRIHEYKRQLLNALHIVHQYLSIVEDGQSLPTPKTYVFAGKAAPGYWLAKQIIKLVNSIARVINEDPRIKDQLRVVFMPDYRVSLAERIIPAADLSEQISTAGMEASGTGNMKFTLNGALTIGTLDGANVEIREEVGEENIFIFGLKADEIQQMKKSGSYKPSEFYSSNPNISRVLDAFRKNIFSTMEPNLFNWVCETLLDHGDQYFLLADFQSYVDTQARASNEFLDRSNWAKKAIVNVAGAGKFSSDRTIAEYAGEIWDIKSFSG